VLRVLSKLPEKGSIRGLARATNHSQDTISKWMRVAGNHCREVDEYYLNSLKLEQYRSMRYGPTLKKEKNLKDSDPFDYGDSYSLTAIKPDTRLFISHYEGKRTA
jgi:hypothetical protein